MSETTTLSFNKAFFSRNPPRRASAIWPPPINPHVFGSQILVPFVNEFCLSDESAHNLTVDLKSLLFSVVVFTMLLLVLGLIDLPGDSFLLEFLVV